MLPAEISSFDFSRATLILPPAPTLRYFAAAAAAVFADVSMSQFFITVSSLRHGRQRQPLLMLAATPRRRRP